MTDSWIEVGRVRSANAGAREVRVNARAGYAHAFDRLTWIRFRRGGEAMLRCKVLRTRADGDVMIVGLGPGISRDVVGQLRGAAVVMMADEMPPRPGRPFGLADMMGLRVILPDGQELGTIDEVFEGPANDAFAVERPDGGRSILPAIDAVVQSVDLEQREMRVGDIGPYVVEV